MPIEKIFEKIMSVAGAEASRILAEAGRKAGEVTAEYEKEASALSAKLEAYAARKAGEERKHVIVGEQLRLRKEVLAKKREILDSVYEEARKKILALGPGESRGILRGMILSSAVSGDEEVVLPASEGDVVTQAFLDELSGGFGRGKGFRIAPDRGEFEWGVVLREGRRVVDLSLDVVFRQLREKTEPRIASLLFGGGAPEE